MRNGFFPGPHHLPEGLRHIEHLVMVTQPEIPLDGWGELEPPLLEMDRR